MIVKKLGGGPWADVVQLGNMVGVNGEVEIDLSDEQCDEQRTIDVCVDENGSVVVGHGESYIATIIIPPRRYLPQEDEGDEGGSTPVALPVDADAVELRLWPYTEDTTERG